MWEKGNKLLRKSYIKSAVGYCISPVPAEFLELPGQPCAILLPEASGFAKNGVAPGLVPPPARDTGLDVHSANPSRERSLCMPVALAVEDCAAGFGDGQNLPAGSRKLLRK